MKTIFLIGFILLFVILFITYPFKITWHFHLNLFKNIGFVVFKVLFVRLLCERFKINNKGEIDVEKEKRKNKNELFFRAYIYSLAAKVNVKKIDLFCDVGVQNDAYFLSVFEGAVNSFASSLLSVILNKYKNVKIFSNFKPYFDQEKFEITGKIIVCFNIVDVLFSLLNAFRICLKNKKERVL